MNIQVSQQWANAITVEHRGMRKALEEIVELAKRGRDHRLQAIHGIASLALATTKSMASPIPFGTSESGEEPGTK